MRALGSCPLFGAMYAHGHLAILRGNLSPEGCVAKITGLKNPVMTGPARVFEDEQSALAAIMPTTLRANDLTETVAAALQYISY